MRYRKKRAVLCKIFCIDLPFHDDGSMMRLLTTLPKAGANINREADNFRSTAKKTHTHTKAASNKPITTVLNFFLLKTRPLIGGFESYAVSVSSRVCQGFFLMLQTLTSSDEFNVKVV